MKYTLIKKWCLVLGLAGMMSAGSCVVFADGDVDVQDPSVQAEYADAGDTAIPDGSGQIGTLSVPAANNSGETTNLADSEPVTTEPDQTESVTTEPIQTEPVTTEPDQTEPVTTEPIQTEPVTTEPVQTEPAITEPVQTEPVTTEPIQTEPVTTEPIQTEPVSTDPVLTDPVSSDLTQQDTDQPGTDDTEKSDALDESADLPSGDPADLQSADMADQQDTEPRPVMLKAVLRKTAAPAALTSTAAASAPAASKTAAAPAAATAAKTPAATTAAKTPVVKTAAKAPAAKTAAKAPASSTSKQLVPNGVYSLLSALNPFKAIDIYGGSKADRANAQAFDLNNTNAQHFQITYHPEDGTYSIMNVQSGKYLDVYGGFNADGTNVHQFTGNNTRAQRWVIKQLPNGNYTFLSALGNHERALDLAGGASANGTNLQIFQANGTPAQQFRLQSYNPSLRTSVGDGIYVMQSGLKSNGSAVVDITGASMANGANAQLFSANGTPAQQFAVTYTGGAFRIMSVSSGRVLTLKDGKAVNGGNVMQDQTTGTASQKWQIMDAGDGTVYIKSALGDVYLDIAGGLSANGTNVQVFEGNGTKAQRFRLQKQTSGPVANGVYFIENAVKPSMTVDIMAGSKKMQANAQIYEKNGTAAQKFQFTRGSDGLYTILNCNSGHSLDIAGGSNADGGNLQQYRANGTFAQKWIVKPISDGSIMLINAGSGKALDITAGKITTGSNLQQYSPNGTGAQRFRLEKTTGTVNTKPDYSIEPPLVTLQYTQANAVLNRVGRNLRAAHNWSAGLPYADCGMDISAGSRALANKAFTTNTGDCYTMAASLYEMAKVLGYNAHQMFGYVPLARGGMGVHSWVEIDQGGSTYICDPDFQNETGGNGYMIHYGMSGTWRYTDYRRIN